jgi:hypothetical protein
MRDGEPHRDFLGRLVAWAGQHDLIRASLLTSTRATNPAAVDRLSDYDVILYVTDIAPFGDREHWLPALGTVLVRMSPIEARVFDGLPGYWEGVIYDDGTKADFTIVPVELLRRAVATARLPAELDHGYQVLLDKDELAVCLPRRGADRRPGAGVRLSPHPRRADGALPPRHPGAPGATVTPGGMPPRPAPAAAPAQHPSATGEVIACS